MVHVSFRAGQVVGDRYRLQRLLGFGAMGSVWSARELESGAWYALKFMHPEVEQDPKLLRRFFQEATSTGALDHPSIVKVFGLGPAPAPAEVAVSSRAPSTSARDVPFLVMELLRGEPLASVLQRDGGMGVGTALGLVRELASALELAHRSGVVHRDLKPANIFLHRTDEGRVMPKILDFGVAKLMDVAVPSVTTTVGALIGSPGYMSPEQIRGERHVDRRSDLWALGVLLYRCICGRAPFRAEDRDGLVHAIVVEAHPRATPARGEATGSQETLSPAVHAIIDRCLAKSPAERFPSAEALAHAIDAVLASERLAVTPIEVVDHDPSDDAHESGAVGGVDLEGPTMVEGGDRAASLDPSSRALSQSRTLPAARGGDRAQVVAALLAAGLAAVIAISWAVRARERRTATEASVEPSAEVSSVEPPASAGASPADGAVDGVPTSVSSSVPPDASAVRSSPAKSPRTRSRPPSVSSASRLHRPDF